MIENTTDTSLSSPTTAAAGSQQPQGSVSASPWWMEYISIARPDHWFKNVFMLIGVVLAFFYRPELIATFSFFKVAWAFMATCIIASSNYVINEILDAPTDLSHPVKFARPIPSGRVNLKLAYLEWILLAVLGLWMSWQINSTFFFTALVLLGMGVIYNVSPVRSKNLPYLDVLSESVNNPIRLVLGWSVVSTAFVPPLSLLISYWMIGAFFMATKRFAEYRSIGDPIQAAAYRGSFKHYTDNKLLVSMFFYATAAALFLGVFIIRYRLELLLSVPLIAGFFSYYMHVALKAESSVQAPEKLYRETGLMIYLFICVAAFVALMFLPVPALYEWFNVAPSTIDSLWKK
jgi:decaprenyl-phosphate phosphoribosyltransferase